VPYLQGFGAYLPEHVVSNRELAERLGCTPEWIEDMSGIRERRFAGAGETLENMAIAAGRLCLERCRIQPQSVGMVIVSAGTAEHRFPGPAAPVAAALGLNGVPALDVSIASAGSLYGLVVAHDMAPRYDSILVIAAEKMSGVAFGDPVEKGTAILFGDGAGACLVTKRAGPIRIVDCALHSDGSFAKDLRLENTGGVLMNGRSVIMQASRKIPGVIEEVLARNGVEASGVTAFLMHQANQNLIDRVARSLRVDPMRFYSNIARYGNTSSASMLIAAAEWWEAHRPVAGARLAFAAFGAGFHWGAILAEVVA
jgi:3-oxoacyl-[acyl-carrier-protein] synthase-3